MKIRPPKTFCLNCHVMRKIVNPKIEVQADSVSVKGSCEECGEPSTGAGFPSRDLIRKGKGLAVIGSPPLYRRKAAMEENGISLVQMSLITTALT